ncbi:hypothetical protein EVAR_49413_1 [Eumeta japonica]|uniref:Uncharacterized protein n=1 Tax=Eumeta variegata TaxID=151549 RepID=A0A4C1Y9F4_EUMVA|nr:hypothetical protein EVAR_49413_1 [Eumeta japonica]
MVAPPSVYATAKPAQLFSTHAPSWRYAGGRDYQDYRDEADITAPPPSASCGPKPPTVFIQRKDRGTELRKKCVKKNINFSQARNSARD